MEKTKSLNAPDTIRESGGVLDKLLLFIENNFALLYIFYVTAFLILTITFRVCFDYRAYLLQWRIVVEGRDPWTTPVSLGMNAYGPLHNVYGLLFLIDRKLPRILGSMLWLAALWPVARRIVLANFTSQRRLWLLLAVTVNPFIWGWVAEYGSNDAFVAVFLVFALLAMWGRASVIAGLFVALAGLMKFYPMLVVPFMAFDRRKLDIPFVATALGVFAAGMAGAGAIWGSSVLVPIAFAAGREPSQLSIYEFLAASALSPLKGVSIPSYIAQCIFMLALLVVFIGHIWRRVGQVEGMVLGLLTVLSAYQLGHFQFYLPLILIIPLTIALTTPASVVSSLLMLVLATVSAFAICYELFGGLIKPPWLYIRQNCSLPTVIAEAMAIIAILRGGGTNRDSALRLRIPPHGAEFAERVVGLTRPKARLVQAETPEPRKVL
jgi:hypothetical protein